MGSKSESIIGYLVEKIKGIGGESMMTMMKETTQAKLKEMGANEMIQKLQEKLGIDGESITRMKDTVQAKLKEMGANEMIQNLQEKLKGIDEENIRRMKEAQAKLKEMGADEMIHNLVEKLKELLLMLGKFGLYLMAVLNGFVKVDELDMAQKLFDAMPSKNVVSWNIMMTAYLENDEAFTAGLMTFLPFNLHEQRT